METKPKFIEVNEQERTYFYPKDAACTFVGVKRIAVSGRKEGLIGGEGHRLETIDGQCWVVAAGWLRIQVIFKDGKGWTF